MHVEIVHGDWIAKAVGRLLNWRRFISGCST